jgi:hypothetical protein
MTKSTSKERRKYPVKDATKDIILTVTEADIKGAKRRDNAACAAANALCRQEHYKQAKVFKTKTYVQMKDGTWLRFITPKSLYIELMVFDRGGKMEATEFRIAAPTGAMKLGYHVKPKGKGGQTGRTPQTMHTIDNVRENAPKGRDHFKVLFD